MLKPTIGRRFVGLSGLLAVVALTAFLGSLTPSFEKCIAEYGKEAGQHETQKAAEIFPSGLIENGRGFFPCEGEFLDANGVLITALATIAIAWFTFSLRQSTDKLWDISVKQAQTAERAYTELERPYVYVDFPESGLSVSAVETSPSGVCVLRCTNHGRTPADITQLNYDWEWRPRGEWPEPFRVAAFGNRTRPPGAVIGPGGVFTEETRLWGHFSPEQLDEFHHDRGSIFVTGYVRYADPFGAHHITGFNAALDHISGKFVLRGDARFNYTRTERERPTAAT